MKCLHVITSLSDGGAESVLYRLCVSDPSNLHLVISMTDSGKYGPLLEKVGVRVTCLNMLSGKISISSLWYLFNILRREKPDVVQTWMYHADLIGGLISKAAGIKNVFWNIRHSELEPGKSKRSTILVAKACAVLSKWIPKKIVCCATWAKKIHIDYGYDASKIVVIGNGYNLKQLGQDHNGRARVRQELRLIESELLLGMVGRYNVQKNHHGLLQSLSLLKRHNITFKCALVGRDMNSANSQITGNISDLGLENEVLLLGQRDDIPDLMNALDIHVLSSSFGEGFPNVLAEAMACGTPCITTDVGDAAHIVGDTGWVVPVNDCSGMLSALNEAITEIDQDPIKWASRREMAVKRINDEFSIDKMVNAYLDVWSGD